MGGEAGWQQTSSSALAPLETLGPISTTKSHLSLLRGPPAAHGDATALEAAVPLPISQRDCNWCMLSAGTGEEVSHGQHPRSISVVAHPSYSTAAAPWYSSSTHLSCGNGITISLLWFQPHLISEVTASITSSVASQHPARPWQMFLQVLPPAVSHGATLEQFPSDGN